ncbi:diguanylate cyclase domain-containing protein, partial [Rhodopseudomonas palustris]
AELRHAAERLCRVVSDLKIPHPGLGERGIVTISIGASVAAPDESLAEALERADQLLYRAKQGGRNQVTT